MNATQAAIHAISTAVLGWMFLAFILVTVISIFRVFILPGLKGKVGEAGINSLIRTSSMRCGDKKQVFSLFHWERARVSGGGAIRELLDQGYQLIPNVTLPTPDGTTQIDHVVVSRYGIFVIETKNYKGWIYGGERDAQWTQTIFKKKSRFQNPLRQNYKHVKTLSGLTGIPMDYFKSIVVFVGECTFKTSMPENVLHGGGLLRHIRSHQQVIIKDSQIAEIADTIQEWAGTVTEEKKAEHVENLRKNRKSVSVDSGDSTACPRCGKEMVLRTNKKQGSQFWGCPGFPRCRGTRPV